MRKLANLWILAKPYLWNLPKYIHLHLQNHNLWKVAGCVFIGKLLQAVPSTAPLPSNSNVIFELSSTPAAIPAVIAVFSRLSSSHSQPAKHNFLLLLLHNWFKCKDVRPSHLFSHTVIQSLFCSLYCHYFVLSRCLLSKVRKLDWQQRDLFHVAKDRTCKQMDIDVANLLHFGTH